MKTIGSSMWKWGAAIALAAGIFASVPAEAAEILTFEFSALAGNEATAGSSGNDANLNASTISRGAGLVTAGNTQRFNAISWAVTSIANAVSGNDYMEFTITPQAGYQFDVSSIKVQWQRSSTGNTQISLRSSVDSYASDLGGVWTLSDVATTVTNTFTFTQNNSTAPVTYRFYSYAEATGGSGGPGDGAGNDIVVNGTVTSSGGASAPSVTTVAASAIDTTSATANGDVTSDGGDTVTERGVCYKTSSGVAITDSPTAAAAGGTGAFSVDLSSLDVNQIYYFKAYAINSIDTTLAANELNFTTLANVPAAPTVDNPTVSTLDVTVNENGNPASTEFAIQRTSDSLYLQADGSFGASAIWATKATWGTKTATGLASSTEYSFQVKARNGASVETAFGTTASETTSAAPTGIWINPMSAGTPIGTFYLGDTMGEWFINFEIGQESWNYAQVGIGTSTEGTDYNWGEASWYQDGDYPNKRVRRNLTGTQFTSVANHYVICQAKAAAEDAYTSKSGNGWDNSTAYPPADLASAYFTVSALNDPSDQSATADQSTQINLLWSNNAQDHDVMVVHKLATDSWTEPTQGTSYAADDAIGAGTVVYKGGAGVFYDTGLLEDTTYDYKFYSVNNDYYSAGVTAQETTLACEPDAPTGLYASDTNETDFTATWAATDRATAYRLDVSTEEQFGTSSSASDLFISEYIEGSSNNKAVEIFNGTGAPVDLSAGGYTLRVYANGGVSPSTITLSGTIAAGDVFVVANGSANAAILAQADMTSGSLTHNGNDQIALAKSAVNIDVIGTIGVNVTNLIDVTKVRKSSVSQGTTTYDVAEWDNYAVDTTDYLGSHTYTGGFTPSFVAGYENLLVESGTSQAVSGLADNTTYYFRVRAEGEGGCPSVNSDTASVTTLEAIGGPQTIDFPAITDKVTTDVVELSATASSGLTVSFAVESGPASIADLTNLTFTGAGEVSIVASQAGGGGWDPADPVTNTFNVTKATATVTLDDLAQAYDGTERVVTATTDPVGLTVDITYEGNAWAPTNPGSYEVIGTIVDDIYQGSDTETLVVSVAAPASFSATGTGLSDIELAFAANAAANDVVIVFNETGTFDDPSGAPPAVGEAFAGGTVVYVGTSSPQTHSDLSSCTPYFYKAWSQIDGFYSTGLTDDASTATPDAPTGLYADPTNLTSFTANWDEVAGASGYRLDVSTEEEFQSGGNGALFISEVADPFDAANAKFVELYNASGSAIDFGTQAWFIWRQANGGSWGNVQLSGTIAAGDTFVVAYQQAAYELAFVAPADQYSGIISGNGDDGYFLVQGGDDVTMGTIVDAFGVIDQDGTGFAWEYLDKNAVRNADVASPAGTWAASEWTIPGTTVNVADMTPGSHTCTGDIAPSFVAGYDNLAVAGTSQLVNGLVDNKTYYYRVRTEIDGGCTSADSTTATVTTLPKTPATVELMDLLVTYDGTPKAATVVTDPEGLTVVVTYDGSGTVPTAAGNYAVVATVDDPVYAGSASDTLVISMADQTIDFAAIADQMVTDTVELSATATSGLTVGFEVVSGPGSISGGTTLTFTGVGDVSIRASQTGDDNWNAAEAVTRTFTVRQDTALVISQDSVNVREGGEGRFFVRLNQDPGASTAVTVSRSAGDASIAIQSGANWAFNSANWSIWQVVTLAQADDANADSEEATFQVSMAGVDDQFVTATALDDDIGANLALASSGTTISAAYPCRQAQLIDGVHNVRTNYGYVVCTSVPPGTITLDLRAVSTVSRVRLLTWDWVSLDHRYTIESSTDGASWETLIDASGADRHGWEDWPLADVSLRYLRFTGVSSSQIDAAVAVSELEVYGTRTMPGRIEVAKSSVNVREGGEGRIFVRMMQDPGTDVAVAVSRSEGDASIAIQSGGTWSFNSANWSAWQVVTLAQADDANAASEEATFRISMADSADEFVTATALDDDVGENLALASGGATISGSSACLAALAIDGVHTVRTNYGYVIWTNDPSGTMTVDMKQAMTVSRVRLLNWDWVYRVHRYKIETSTDNVNWTLLADASAEDHAGWDEWTVSERAARYLKFTGLSNSANQFVVLSELEVFGTRTPPPEPVLSSTAVNVREAGEGRFFVRLPSAPAGSVVFTVSRTGGDAGIAVQSGSILTFKTTTWSAWQAVTLAASADGNADNETATFRISAPGFADTYVTATALDKDIGDNWALSSALSTISGVRAVQPASLIDGVHLSSANYGYTIWTNSLGLPPGTMTLDLKEATTLSRVRLLNYDWSYRPNQYKIESSLDNATWSPLVDASAGNHSGWEDWAMSGQSVRYLRFTGLSNSASFAVCVAELEVYGTRAGKRVLAAAKGASVVVESEPISVLTSDGVEDETGWNAVDGDDATAWVGQKVGGGYVVVEYAPTLNLSALEVDMAEGSLTGIEYLYSLDAKDWQPLPEDMEKNPVSLNYLWLVFPDDGTEAVPNVIEIRPNP